MALLDVNNLVITYAGDHGPVQAVNEVSFSIPGKGETLGLIGESGSGKTSIANALMRTLPANTLTFTGGITLEGQDLMALSDEAYRRNVRWQRIAVVFQGAMSAFNPVKRVGFQVAERLLLQDDWDRKRAMEEARRLLDAVGLHGGVAERFPHELSGGMKQRAVVAMALAMNPSLLILDEPTSALDVSVQAQIMNLFKKLKWEMGISMIFITHDIALASDISDRVAVLQRGRLNEYGPAEDVLQNPEDPYTRRLLLSVPRLFVASPDADPSPRRRSDVPLLQVESVRVHFPVRKGFFRKAAVKAIDGVSLKIHKGETLALVGESGSGKTTLARATLGLIKPTDGKALFDGVDVAEMDAPALKAFRRRAQVVFQDPYSSMSPFMSVYEVVEEPLLIHGIGADKSERIERVYNALHQVNLTPPEEIAAKFPHSLSGGQRQRVSIARAMVLEPEYVVADEPVSMIDASSRIEILKLLRSLQEQKGIAFLYITHDIASARHFADRIAVMYLGTVVEIGPSAQVIDNPLHPYTQALLRAVPVPDPTNRTRLRPVIPGEPPSPIATPSGCPFVARCPDRIEGKCDVERPDLQEIEPGHLAACHLFEIAEVRRQTQVPKEA